MKIGIIGGSGLDDPKILTHKKSVQVKTPYGSPADKLTVGKIGDIEVVVLARHGKKHAIPPTRVPFQANIWAMHKMGCTALLATTACGSLRDKFKPGEIVFIDQFIDFSRLRKLTFFDKKVVHTAMSKPFDENLRKILSFNAKKLKIPYHNQGTMITIEGPRFSTIAESKMFQIWGADLINMSTAPEVILANELKIPYQTIAMVTDYDCWKEDAEPVTFEMVMARMEENAEKVKKLLINTINALRSV